MALPCDAERVMQLRGMLREARKQKLSAGHDGASGRASRHQREPWPTASRPGFSFAGTFRELTARFSHQSNFALLRAGLFS